MPTSFTCKHCGRRLRGVPANGRLALACSGCGHRFRQVNGRLVSLSGAARVDVRDSHDKASSWAVMAGGAMMLTIAFLVGAFDGGVGAALISASFGGIACGVLLKRQMTREVPVRYMSPDTHAAFATATRLRRAKATLTRSRGERTSALRDREHLRNRLTGLRQRMEDLTLAAYRPRIASIGAALVMLDRQIDMDVRLRNAYDRNIKMIEIELDAGVAADQMNEDVSAAIVSAMGELRALEECQAELERQLEANVEVEQLLRVSGQTGIARL